MQKTKRSKNVVNFVLLLFVTSIVAACAPMRGGIIEIGGSGLSAPIEQRQAEQYCAQAVSQWRMAHGKAPVKLVSTSQIMRRANPFSVQNMGKAAIAGTAVIGTSVVAPILGGIGGVFGASLLENGLANNAEEQREAVEQVQQCIMQKLGYHAQNNYDHNWLTMN